MKRGDIVIGSAPGDFTSKPRPYVVVQADRVLEDAITLTVCPLTTHLIGIGRIRIAIAADGKNGLDADSEIEVDRVTTLRRARFQAGVGRAPPDVMLAVDAALRRWLDL